MKFAGLRRFKNRICSFLFSKSAKTKTMQPRLNPNTLIPDILFAIGKKLIEDGDSDALIHFAFSGIEPMKAIKNVFASVKTLKLCENCFYIGWNDNPCCKFEFHGDTCSSKILVKLIGNAVKNLQICCNISDRDMYKSFIDVITEKKQLISFSADSSCSRSFINEFLPHFSSTLKHVSIPCKSMTPTLRESLNLESFTILNPQGYNFSLLCKTTSLKLSYMLLNDPFIQRYDNVIYQKGEINPNLSSVKELIIDDIYISYHIDQFKTTIKDFPLLESIIYNISMKFGAFSVGVVRSHISRFTHMINQSKNVPSKITCFFFNSSKIENAFDLDQCKILFDDFIFGESNPDFYSFGKIIHSVKGKTFFDVHFSK